jgi:hypothetical protein
VISVPDDDPIVVYCVRARAPKSRNPGAWLDIEASDEIEFDDGEYGGHTVTLQAGQRTLMQSVWEDEQIEVFCRKLDMGKAYLMIDAPKDYRISRIMRENGSNKHQTG